VVDAGCWALGCGRARREPSWIPEWERAVGRGLEAAPPGQSAAAARTMSYGFLAASRCHLQASFGRP